MFEVWSTPHYGVRYVIDVEQAELVSARSFADTVYIENSRSGSAG